MYYVIKHIPTGKYLGGRSTLKTLRPKHKARIFRLMAHARAAITATSYVHELPAMPLIACKPNDFIVEEGD
jgi:hypothetical protein